jgi:hypothetical protein
MNKNILYLLGLLIIGLSACDQNLLEKNEQFTLADTRLANVKIVNAYQSNVPVGATGVGVTRFFVYQDNKKLNGNALASPGSWPGSLTYASVAPGTSTLRMILDRRVNNIYGAPVVGDTVMSKQVSLSEGKFYTLYMIDSFPKQDLIVVEDNFKRPDTGVYQVRVSNLVVSPARPINIWSRRHQKMIAENVGYKGTSQFITLPITATPDTLDMTETLSTVTPRPIIASLNTFTPGPQRTVTLYVQGRFGFRAQTINSFTND